MYENQTEICLNPVVTWGCLHCPDHADLDRHCSAEPWRLSARKGFATHVKPHVRMDFLPQRQIQQTIFVVQTYQSLVKLCPKLHGSAGALSVCVTNIKSCAPVLHLPEVTKTSFIPRKPNPHPNVDACLKCGAEARSTLPSKWILTLASTLATSRNFGYITNMLFALS